MRFGIALTFPLQDAHWFRKVFGAAACLCLPLLGAVLAAGWGLDICRREIRSLSPALPGAALRRNWKDGLAVWGILLVCSLPFWLWLGLGGIVDWALIPEQADPGAVVAFWWGFEAAALALAAASTVWAVAAVGRLADTGSLREALRMRGIVRAIRIAPAVYGLTVCSWLGLGLLALSGIAVCGVGVFFTSAYAAAAAFHLAGQAHARAAGRTASPGA